MNDIWHYFGGDVLSSVTGDLQPVDTTIRGQQRVLRRLLTNPGDYIWHPTYGAGLGRFIGSTATAAEIVAVIRQQMALEDAVAPDPAPVISVTPINGGLSVSIRYVDAQTKTQQTLAFDVNT
jgi:hypothetical protein